MNSGKVSSVSIRGAVLCTLLLLMALAYSPAFAEEGALGNAADPAATAKKERAARKPGKKAGRSLKTITVTSDRMEADRSANVVVFKGNVAAEEDFLICSDELYLNYGQGMEMDRLVAVGRVEIYHGGREATSDKAEYNRADRTLVLTGSPVVNQCTDTVRGDKIIFYLDENKAIVDSGGGGRVRAVIMPDKKCPEVPATGKAGGEKTRCKRAR